MRNQRLTSLMTFAWLIAYSQILHAASTLPPFSQDVYGYDYESLGWAAAAGLLGGALRTIFTLASDTAVVGNLGRELLKDALIATIGGLIVYALVQALAGIWPTWFTSQVRMLLITGAGFSRGKWANALGDIVSDALGNIRARVRGGVTPSPQPSSVIGPLEEPPK